MCKKGRNVSGSGFGPTILEVGLRGHLTRPLGAACVGHQPASQWCKHMLRLHKSSGSIQNIRCQFCRKSCYGDRALARVLVLSTQGHFLRKRWLRDATISNATLDEPLKTPRFWRDGFEVKRAHCSCRGPRFHF